MYMVNEPVNLRRRKKQVTALRASSALMVRDYVREHLGEALSITRLASVAHLSSSYFCRSFKVTFGMPAQKYVRHLRMERAARLLAETDMPLIDVALECGLNDQPYFCRCFREAFGKTPGEWRRAFGTAASVG